MAGQRTEREDKRAADSEEGKGEYLGGQLTFRTGQSRGRWFNSPTAVSKLRQFCLPYICLCLSEETLKAIGPIYLVSMPGEVKDPTQGLNV